MERKMELLLVEDDISVCKEFAAKISETRDMLLIGTTNEAQTALKKINECVPDAVILDLELHCGGGTGLNVLEGLGRLSLPKRPYVLVTTNNTSAATYEAARRFGADFIMSKYQQGYSVESVLDFLRMMRSVIQAAPAFADRKHCTSETEEQYHHRIQRRIMSELDLVGISPKAVGYQYLTDAVEITMKQPVQGICTIIAKQHRKSEASVERAMQGAINRAWATSSIDDLLRHYTAKINSSKGAPTVTEFICHYANKLKMDCWSNC